MGAHGAGRLTALSGVSRPGQTQWQTNLELTFNIIFTVEMFMKIVALGFVVGRFTYLRDHWNVLDFIIVTTSWLPILLSLLDIEIGGNMQAIRAFRLLRPLRAINRMIPIPEETGRGHFSGRSAARQPARAASHGR